MTDALHESPAAGSLGLYESLLLGLALRMQEDPDHRCCKHRQDDCESAKCPTPILFVELLSNIRSSVSHNDIWRRSEGVCQATVAESRCVKSDHVDGEGHTSVADAVEDLKYGAVSMGLSLEYV